MRKALYNRPQMLMCYDVQDLMAGGAGFTSITCFEEPPKPQCDIKTE